MNIGPDRLKDLMMKQEPINKLPPIQAHQHRQNNARR
jgi:hypothetical protein